MAVPIEAAVQLQQSAELLSHLVDAGQLAEVYRADDSVAKLMTIAEDHANKSECFRSSTEAEEDSPADVD